MKNDLDGLRQWADVDPGYWFAPKLFGWGATPVTWQGWLATALFVALILLDARATALPLAARIAVGIVLVAGFVVLAWRKTEGGWHWHWGLPKR